MKRKLIRSSAFVRAAKRLVRKHPHVVEDLQSTLELLSADAFHPHLKTHQLKGDLKGSMACSLDRDLRILFAFVQHEGAEAILVQTVGTHDEVY